ncbi:APC family permease [Acidisoma cladoniae]|uniref:APC family permease n=1 Tax=Acidisoma cladoniae TaxID=3040935 RepID=UPI00254D915D|nr:APC family permease [Acidisoma sp. PAMC 29798]
MSSSLPAMRALKQNCLGPVELLAQGIALISPTMTAALIIPVMYSNTGDWSWLSYALGTIMLLFVAFSLNQFASRSASSGSMYGYIRKGLGMSAGGIGGWSLIWAYIGISIAGATGFAIFAGKLLAMIGIPLPTVLLFAICVGISGYCAWKNVAVSAKVMLIFEGVSMVLIGLLCLIALKMHGFTVDPAQVNTAKIPFSSLGLGVVVAIFSLVGFESATAFGDEARNPLKSIPRAVWLSLVISGAFFVFVTYVMVQTTHGYKTTLDQIDAPLNVMAQLVHMPFLQAPLSACAMISFFALNLSCLNAGGRVIYSMGRQGLFHQSTAESHAKNETPHVAVLVMGAISFLAPAICILRGMAPLDVFNDAGTLAAFGFLVPYILIAIAAPVYLKSIGQMKPGHIALAAVSLVLLTIPTVGSVYPVPPAPVKYFPYLFLAYLIIGAAWITLRHRTIATNPRFAADMMGSRQDA